MMAALRQAYASFRGFEAPGGAVPAMDGPLRPNSRLDAAPVVAELADVDNLVATADGLVCSQGADLVALAEVEGAWSVVRRDRMPSPITCLAVGPDGTLAVGLDGRGLLLRGGSHDGAVIEAGSQEASGCITAAAFLDRDTLAVTNGSATLPAAEWKRDLMRKGASGSVWRLGLADGSTTRLAGDLAFPSGVAPDGAGGLFVSEAWRHRVLRLDAAGASTPVVALGDLPAYPGRIAAAPDGGYWLALFAPRNPLVEFVLGETQFRTRMIERIDPDHWIAPALASGRSFLEPIQGGARKKLNQLKPWSPSWSYGLLALADRGFALTDSLHSRADGRVHGVTAACAWNGRVFAAAKGAGRIVEVGP